MLCVVLGIMIVAEIMLTEQPLMNKLNAPLHLIVSAFWFQEPIQIQ